MTENPPPPSDPYNTPAAPQQPPPAYGAPPPPSGPPTYQPSPGSPYGGSSAETTDAAGFFKALFDFGFSSFVTPKVVKFVYILATIMLVLGWLSWLVAGFSQSVAFGLFVLVVGAIALVVYLAIIRMMLEFFLAIVRMSQDIHHRLPRP